MSPDIQLGIGREAAGRRQGGDLAGQRGAAGVRDPVEGQSEDFAIEGLIDER